jgi:hypothetical protein
LVSSGDESGDEAVYLSGDDLEELFREAESMRKLQFRLLMIWMMIHDDER